MNEIPHPGFDKPEQYETFTTTNGLEEAADNHIRKVIDTAGHPGWDWTTQDIAEAFIAGAERQKEQDLKCISEIHRNGYNLCKEQMMKEAIDGEIYGSDGEHWIETNIDENIKGKDGDKVRVIVIPNTDEK